MRQEFEKVLKALENCHPVDKTLMVPTSEFKRRQAVTWAALGKAEFGLPVFTSGQCGFEAVLKLLACE